MHRIALQVQKVIHSLQGDWIVPKNAYEKNLCKALDWQVFDNRYYDACNGEVYIEIKKGQSSMHFDLCRYAEILLGHGQADTVTVFFRRNKARKQITDAYIIDTKHLIEFLQINKAFALLYLRVKARVPRGVNILASATAKDLRELSTYIVQENGSIVSQNPHEKKNVTPQRKKKVWTQQSIQTFLKEKRKSENKSSILYYLF